MSKKSLGLEEIMEEFKKFMEHNGEDPEEYDDIVFDMVKIMSLYDAFMQELVAAQQMQEAQKQQKNGKQIMVPEKNQDGGIVTP